MYNVQDIMRFLPHRYPFLLVDKILEIDKGKSIVGIKNVTYNESFFQGHFPEYKIVPGVLLIEAIAQVGGVLLYNSIPNPEEKFVVLSKVDKVKFRRLVIPGDQLRIEAALLKVKTNFAHLRGIGRVDGEIAVEGEVFASLLDIKGLAHVPR